MNDSAVALRSTDVAVERTVSCLSLDKQASMACADNLDFMRALASGAMKLIINSPPYNIGKSYERRLSLERYVNEQTKVISECVRLLNRQGSLCWQVGNHVQNG